MKKIVSISLSLGLFFLSGCGEKILEKDEEVLSVVDVKYPSVEIVKVRRASVEPEISLTGTITTKDEITIASEVAGTVQKVLKKEGDSVVVGKAIISLESHTNLLRASHSSAIVALKNAKKSLSLAKKSAEQSLKDSDLQIKNAKLSLSNAKIAYNRLKDSEVFRKSSNTATKEGSDKMLEIAEKNLEISKKLLKDIFEMTAQTNIRYADLMSNSISSSLIALRSHLDFVDTLVGASVFRKNDNDSFEVYLSGSSGNLIQSIQTDWRIFANDLDLLDNDFVEVSKVKYDETDKDILLPVLLSTLEKAGVLKEILRSVEKMLDKSVSSISFPEARISELKKEVRGAQSSLEERISSLKELHQGLVDFEIQNSQQISAAELAIALRESEFLAKKSENLVVKNSEGVGVVTIDSELIAAKNAYFNAENSLEFAQSQKTSVSIQGDLAIQSALAQVDAAQSLLDQAVLSLSKLTISSGMNGTVNKVLVSPGSTVSPGTPLLIISDYSELKLISDVSLEESFLLKKGMTAEVSIDGVKKKFIGKISVVYPEADKITRRVRVEILIQNKERIPANVFATAVVKLKKESPQLYLPSQVFISQNPPTVMAVVRKKCKKEVIDCIVTYENKRLYVLEKKELVLRDIEDVEFGVAIESGVRRNQYILKNKSNGLFEGDIVFLEKSTESVENVEGDVGM